MLDEFTQRCIRNAHDRAVERFREEYATIQQEVSEAVRDLTAMRKERDQLKGRLEHMRKTTVALPRDADGEVVRLDICRMYSSCGDEFDVKWLMVTRDVELTMWKALSETGQALDVRFLHINKPVLDRDGERIRVGDTLYDANGDAHVVKEVNPDYDGYEDTVFCGELHELNGIPISRMARDLTHKLTDSWEAIAEDAGGEIAERIRALAAGGGD